MRLLGGLYCIKWGYPERGRRRTDCSGQNIPLKLPSWAADLTDIVVLVFYVFVFRQFAFHVPFRCAPRLMGFLMETAYLTHTG